MGKRPNVVFIFSDQQRWDTLGCYGQKLNVTPNLDRMAKEGVLFENAFTCQPVCGPARACLQTGKYATELGCYRNGIGLPKDTKTIAHWFGEAGYQLGYVGKWHLASTLGESKDVKLGRRIDYHTSPIPMEYRGGWKDFWIASDLLEFTSHGYNGYLFDGDMNRVEFTGYRVDAITNFALDFLQKQNGKKPFFLFISYIEPHHQNDHNRYEGPDGSKERFKDYEIPGDLIDTDGDWRENFPDYLGSCNSIDYNVGRVRDELKKLGLSDNTYIIYTSDHGCHFRTRNQNLSKYGTKTGRDDYKRSCHESTIHIPMIIYGQDLKGGKKINNLVSLIDLPPTLLDIAGIEIPEYMQGNSLKVLFDGDVEDWRKEIFLQISESQVGRAIRTKRYKYSVRSPEKNGMLYASSDLYIEDFLYDLENDPHERNNLVNNPEYRNVRDDLRGRLIKQMVKANEKEVKIETASYFV